MASRYPLTYHAVVSLSSDYSAPQSGSFV
jgi:hypothetical protein